MATTKNQSKDLVVTSQSAGTTQPQHVLAVDATGSAVTFGGSATIGAAVPATATPIGVKDNSGNLAYPQVDGSGNLLVAVTGAGSGGTSSVDRATWTAGTTAGTPLMVAFDDTSPASLAEDKVGVARGSSRREVYTQIRDAAGNERGLNVATDGSIGVTGTFYQATQPISGTVTANLGTIAGASTAAKQPALGTAGTASADVISVQGIASMTALKVDGSAVTQPVSGTVTAISGTATNLKVEAVGTGTFATQAAITAASGSVQSGAIASGAVASGAFASGALAAGSIAVGAITKGATSPVAAEDDASANLDYGVKVMAIQAATPVDTAGSDLDYAMLQMSGGRLWVDASGKTLTASATLQTQTDTVMVGGVNVKEINAVAPLMGAGNTGTGSLRVTIATDQPALTNKLLVTPDANSAVNVAQIGGTTIVTGGVNGTLAIGGNVATNVALGTNPINLGAQAVSAENTAVTATRMAQLVTDLVGKLIVLPYANPENFVSGAITSAMTGTTSTSLLAAPASGLRNYITQITVSNAHATVGTDIIIQDGSGGTTLYTIPAAAVYGGAAVTFPTPLRQPTTATAIYCANVTTGASTKVSASGYKGA